MGNKHLFSNFYSREDIEIRIHHYELEITRLKTILARMDRRSAGVASVKITRGMVMQLMKSNPVDFFQTTTIVDTYFPGLNANERVRQVKILSVYLSGLIRAGLVTYKKLPCVNGYIYKWK